MRGFSHPRLPETEDFIPIFLTSLPIFCIIVFMLGVPALFLNPSISCEVETHSSHQYNKEVSAFNDILIRLFLVFIWNGGNVRQVDFLRLKIQTAGIVHLPVQVFANYVILWSLPMFLPYNFWWWWFLTGLFSGLFFLFHFVSAFFYTHGQMTWEKHKMQSCTFISFLCINWISVYSKCSQCF